MGSKEKITEINIILLAAGNSRRFGSNKLLTDFKGKPLYVHTVDTVLAVQQELKSLALKRKGELQSLNLKRDEEWERQRAGENVGEKERVYCNMIMVSQYEEVLKYASTLGFRTVENKEPEKGISNSIKLGLSADTIQVAEKKVEGILGKSVDEKSVTERIYRKYMFFVCDQPFLRAKSVVGLIKEYLNSEKPMACLAHKEQLGNPCIFDESCVEQLRKLEGDVGGKKIIRERMTDTLKVEIDCEKELWDVDSIQDFTCLKGSLD